MTERDRIWAVLLIFTISFSIFNFNNEEISIDITKNPQEPLICGGHVVSQFYVEEYIIENEYVIDTIHGGIWNVWHCRAFKGEMHPDEGLKHADMQKRKM